MLMTSLSLRGPTLSLSKIRRYNLHVTTDKGGSTMSVGLVESSFTLTNPNPSSWKTASMALCPSSSSHASLRFKSHRITTGAITLSPRGLGLGLLPLHCRSFRNRCVYAFSASRQESKSSEVEVEKEKSDLTVGAEESQEAWKQTLESFKEQALKMQSVSQEAYELYSEKAMVILKETSEQLKIQAEKASHDLTVVAKEISEEGKEYLSTAAEKSPEPVKDIVETFASSTNELNEISKVRDFYLGIPYGVLLSFGGFLSFMLTGSTSAIRFGVILGGTLLALSISSLRSWKRGESSSLALKGQAGLASVLFLREMRLLLQRPLFGSYFAVLVSGAMVAFYLYRITLNGEQTKGSLENGTEN